MDGGGHDISQNLVNIGKLTNNPRLKNTSLAKKLPDPGPLAQEILPFCNGSGTRRTMPATATENDVKVALAEFTDLYKRIATTYAAVIAGKIK